MSYFNSKSVYVANAENKMLFRLQLILLVSIVIITSAHGEKTFKCSPGWELCLSTNECVPSMCLDYKNAGNLHICGDGQAFCGSMKRCVPVCPNLQHSSQIGAQVRSEADITCRGELIFCFSQGDCVLPNQCPDGNSVSCPPNTAYCFSTAMCQSLDNPCGPLRGQTSCSLGEEFCLATMKCETSCPSRKDPFQQREAARNSSYLKPLICPPGMVFCHRLGRCTPKRFCIPTNPFSQLQNYRKCSSGQVFCLKFGRCLPASVCNSIYSNEFETIKRTLNNYYCAEGEVFCSKYSKCVKQAECPYTKDEKDLEHICSNAEVFCPDLRMCVKPEECGKKPASLNTNEMAQEICEGDKIFCPATGSCQEKSECNKKQDTQLRQCSSGSVYCVKQDECRPKSRGCGRSSATIQCDPGTVFCINQGQCSANCDAELLWKNEELECPTTTGRFNYSNCITSLYCPERYKCCPDLGTFHQQCISLMETVPSDVLSGSCNVLMTSKENTDTGISCNIPEDCPPSSLCCNEKCRTPRGILSCPLKTFFCHVTGKCERLGTACVRPCPPNQVYCIAKDACTKIDNCEFQKQYNSTWTMPRIFYVSDQTSTEQNSGEVVISSLYPPPDNKEEPTLELLVVETKTRMGAFETKETESSSWMTVETNTILKTSSYMRFTHPSSGYYFAADYLNITVKDMGITRYIVQPIAPKRSEINFTLIHSHLMSLEDQEQMASLYELLNFEDEDWKYWDAWKNWSDILTEYSEMGILDYSHPSTINWVEMLTQPNLEFDTIHTGSVSDNGPQGTRGIQIEYTEDSSNGYFAMDQQICKMESSIDGGESWQKIEFGRPVRMFSSSVRSLSKIILRFRPLPNAWGNVSVTFTALPPESPTMNGHAIMFPDDQRSQTLNFEIAPVNDAPYPKIMVDLMDVPMLTISSPELKLKAEDLAAIFYQDDDNGRMGIGIFYAQRSDLGTWSYTLDGEIWIEINTLEDYIFADMHTSGEYQGYLRVPSKDPLIGSTIMDSLHEPVIRTSDRRNSRQRQSSVERQAIYTTFANGSLVVSHGKVQMMLLPSSASIKFQPKNPSKFWGETEAFLSTRLVFTAWNGPNTESENKVEWINTSFPFCQKCQGHQNLASTPVKVVALWRDGCGDGPSSDGILKKVDECGVCGGDNTTCLDCKGNINGDAIFVCGKCDDSGTDLLDCAGECEGHNSLNEDGICVLNGTTPTYCDGTQEAGSFINECGICVEGSTNLPGDENRNNCPLCYGPGMCGCDGVISSTQRFNLCNKCMEPSSPDFNKGCDVLGDLSPAIWDAAVGADLQPPFRSSRTPIMARVSGINGAPKDDSLLNCSFVNAQGNMESEVKYMEYASAKLKVIPGNLEVGEWALKCYFQSSTKVISLIPSEKITVVNSLEVEIESAVVIQALSSIASNSEIVVTLKTESVVTEAKCFLKYTLEQPVYIELPRLEGEIQTSIGCRLDASVLPGEVGVGVALTTEALELVMSGKLDLKTKTTDISGKPPKVLSATLSYDVIVIEFDVNIGVTTECADNFESKDALGNKPKCSIGALTLEVLLGDNASVGNGTELTFSSSNKITEKYADPNTAPVATGSFTVFQKGNDSIYFSLSGDTKVYNGSTAKVFVTVMKPYLFKVAWNVSFIKEGKVWESRDAILMWDSTRQIQEYFDNSINDKYIEFPGSLLRPNEQYLIVAHLEGKNGDVSESKCITIEAANSSDTPLVSIRGPTKIFSDRTYTYEAAVSLDVTSEAAKDVTFQYLWRLNGEKFDATAVDQVTLKAGTLKGGSRHKMSVSVIAEDKNLVGSAVLEIETVLQNAIRVILASDKMRVSMEESVYIDASKSIYLDDPDQNLDFRWTCRTATGEACFYIARDSAAVRFENYIAEEHLFSPILNFMSYTLAPGTYVMMVRVSKGSVNATSTAEVEITKGSSVSLKIQKPEGKVDASKKIVVNGYVKSHEDVTVWWEIVSSAGYEYPPLQTIAKGMSKKFLIHPMHVSHPLIIPKVGSGWGGLKAGSRYRFRLSAFTNNQLPVFMETVIETLASPKYGHLKVTPFTGEALVTNFTFSTSCWSGEPENFPLTAKFGFRLSGSSTSEITWLGSVSSSDLSLKTTLPSDRDDVTVTTIVEVCDTMLSCSIIEGNEVTVNLPQRLPEDVLSKKAAGIEDAFNDDSKISEALSEASNLLSTLLGMGADSQVDALMIAFENMIANKAADLQLSLYEKAEARVASMNLISGALSINSQVRMDGDTISKLVALKDSLLRFVAGVLPKRSQGAPVKYQTAKDIIYYPSSDEVLQAGRTGSYRQKRYAYIRQRSEQEEANKSNYQPMSTEEIAKLLELSEMEIEDAESQLDKAIKMDKLVKEITTYFGSLCVGSTLGDNPSTVIGSKVALKVQKSSLMNVDDSPYVVVDSTKDDSDFIKSDVYVEWGTTVEAMENHSSLCLGTAEYHDDFSTPKTRERSNTKNISSHMIRTSLMNPDKGNEVSVKASDSKIAYLWPLPNSSTPPGFELTCYGWNRMENKGWSTSMCQKTDVSGNFTKCSCRKTGYAGLFLNRIEENNSVTSASTQRPNFKNVVHRVTLLVEEDFNKTVGDDVDKFANHIRTQLAQKFNISEENIQNMEIKPGSILISFDLVEANLTRSSGGKSMDDTYEFLTELLNDGGFMLEGLHSEELLAKKPEDQTQEHLDPSHLPILIGGIVGGVLFIVFIIIILAIYLNNKKRMDKVTPLHGSLPPSYREIHFGDYLDNSGVSLAKERKQSKQEKNGKPDSGAYVQDDENDLYIERSAGGSATTRSDSGLGKDDDDVPDAFRYRSPTKKQLEQTEPIPEHILKKLKNANERNIPGTPEDET